MKELYHRCIVGGPVKYMEDLFRELIDRGVYKKADPGQLAMEYYAPMFLRLNMSDANTDQGDAESRLAAHIERFMESNTK